MQPRTLAFVCIALAALVLPARAGAAQDPPQPQIASVVQPGQQVVVTMADGSVRTGRLVVVRPDAMELAARSRTSKTELPLGQIRRIEIEVRDPVSDSAKRGALIGLAVGGGIGALATIAFCSDGGDCSGGVAFTAILAGMGAGIGAGSGALGDWLIRDTLVVWPAPGGTRSAKPVALGVLAGRGRAGVRLTIRW